eukprot:gb/GEZN01001946.1/.p1 GENE.gb/GEZN01001946.1/~~gb/GEZN01001946.1/.p1  ORF type:complete len:563 (-),score=46.57 gb/GEZN01001946.1/:995-2683(-)
MPSLSSGLRKPGLVFSLLVLVLVRADDQVKVMQPASLKALFEDGLIEHSPALFGVPPAGRSMIGEVIYAPMGDQQGCLPLNATLLKGYEGNVVFILVDRGACTFVEKVRHVQKVGGHAAIIVDNLDEPYLPFMADDGTGGDIQIPSILIGDLDGVSIKGTLARGEMVILKMSWLLPNPDGRVEWMMWTTPVDEVAVDFKRNFGTAVKSLNESAQFTPHYIIMDGDYFGCMTGECGNKCTNGGRYCNYDPDDDPDAGISGADVVQESLRQVCFFDVVNKTGKPQLWWDYVKNFQKNCNKDVAKFGETCSFSVMTNLAVDTAKVQKCIKDSGGYGPLDGENAMFEAEMAAERDYGVRWWPIIYINNSPYYEAISCPAPIDVTTCGPLNMICGGYAANTVPCTCNPTQGCQLCKAPNACGTCTDINSADFTKKEEDCQSTSSTSIPPIQASNGRSESRGMPAGGVVAVVLFSCAAVGAGLFFYFTKKQEKMRNDIDQLLAQYQPMGIDGASRGPPPNLGVPLMGDSNSGGGVSSSDSEYEAPAHMHTAGMGRPGKPQAGQIQAST